MKRIIFLFFISISFISSAQHCPWDCSGMILLNTTISKEKLYKLHPVLVDENKKEVIDTVYATGSDTDDNCEFLSYEDFTAYRTKKITIYYWYGYDTFYHFTQGGYIVKYNFCKYREKKLYLRFEDAYTRGVTFRYIEIPENLRMHLHDYNNELTGRKTKELKKMTQPFVLNITCTQWGLREKDCE